MHVVFDYKLWPQSEKAQLRAAWQTTADGLLERAHPERPAGFQDNPEQFLILVACRDEKQRGELLEWFEKNEWGGRRYKGEYPFEPGPSVRHFTVHWASPLRKAR
jgi:hypothetical protein